MLKARDLTKKYSNGGKELIVLKGISLDIRRAEVLSIVGPSGAGKSTLLHILGGLDNPTSGDVFLEGKDFSVLGDAAKSEIRNTRFGFVFQFYHLLREFTAFENVILPALIKGPSRGNKDVKEKAMGLFEFLGLSDRIKHKPTELSGGEQQRVAIARALINDPEILFCDEPTGNLNFEAGRQIQDMLLSLNQKKGTTIVIVTHSQDIAKSSHRVLKIFDGKLG